VSAASGSRRLLEKRLRVLVPTTRTTLTEIHGVGTIVAAEIKRRLSDVVYRQLAADANRETPTPC
jgi:hypothetical protein